MKSIDRRNFLKNAGRGAVAAAAVAPFVTSGWAANPPSDRINVAVCGIRSRGRAHVQSFSALPGVQVALICDIDERLLPEVVKEVEEKSGKKPRTEVDIRKVVEDKEINAISIATPNHWHALMAIWACQAGKDVYVEKPVSYNVSEGRKIVEAARKYKRIVQSGTQSRSSRGCKEAMKFLHEGGIGDIYMSRTCLIKARDSYGKAPNSPVPEGVHYDLWLGPAPWRPFNEKKFHYNWHWVWDTGNGETGNTGPHNYDRCRWGMQIYEHPREIHSVGNIFVWGNDCVQETPNHQINVLKYSDGRIIQMEVRGWYSNTEEGIEQGEFFYGDKGWLKLDGSSWQSYLGRKNEPGPGSGSSQGLTQAAAADRMGDRAEGHFQNFINCMKSRNHEDLAADILEGHLSTAMCHLSNIAFRTGRKLVFDNLTETFPGDGEANSYLNREYRYPYVVPEEV
ncbi:MAG: Gfo/Idh/MocA family oxidoreductase [Candidatus Glassbacteria bacterium]